MKLLRKAAALLAACALCVPMLSGCGKSIDPGSIQYIQLQKPEAGDDIAIVDTSVGKIVVLLYTDEVPTLVENFKYLVNEGYFDGQVVFHVEPVAGAVAMGSDTPDGNGGNSNTGKPIKATYSDNLWPFSGSVSMLCYEAGMLWSKANYCDSRFFFMGDVPIEEDIVAQMEEYNFPAMLRNSFVECGGVPQFGQFHSVFGKIIDGMEVVNSILEMPLTYEPIDPSQAQEEIEENNAAATNNRPKEDVVINSVTLGTYDPADFPELDNTPSEEAYRELVERSAKEQAEQDAAMSGGNRQNSSTESGE